MKINRKINTSILTDNNIKVLDNFKEDIIISTIDELKKVTFKETFLVFNDVLRYLKKSDFEKFIQKLESTNINFVNITSKVEEVLYTPYLIVLSKDKTIIEGSTVSVLKEERILKRLGYKLPFIVDLSLQLNTYGIIDSIFLDEEILVDRLW